MKAALREGDFKLLKNYATRDHSLYRLSNKGQRDDLEEMKDLATDPQYALVLKDLSAKLDRHLEENQVEGPYLNPEFKGKTKPICRDQCGRVRTIHSHSYGYTQ